MQGPLSHLCHGGAPVRVEGAGVGLWWLCGVSVVGDMWWWGALCVCMYVGVGLWCVYCVSGEGHVWCCVCGFVVAVWCMWW